MNEELVRQLVSLFFNDQTPNILAWRWAGNVLQVKYEDGDGDVCCYNISPEFQGYAVNTKENDFKILSVDAL